MSFSPDLLVVDFHSSDAASLFTQSLHQTGFAVIKNHPIQVALIDAVYHEWKVFFASNNKMDYLFDSSKTVQNGYFPFKSENAKHTPIKDLKEFYHYFAGGFLPETISEQTIELFNQLNSLGTTVLGWIEQNLPADIRHRLSCDLQQTVVGSDQTLLRILHYPPLSDNEEEKAVRAAAHEDINVLTLLPAATAQGLQVQDLKGQWHDVPCDYGSIVVNVGDTLTALTQNYLPATLHRVINPAGELANQSRLSMPLFLNACGDVLLPDGRTAGEFLQTRLEQLGLTAKA